MSPLSECAAHCRFRPLLFVVYSRTVCLLLCSVWTSYKVVAVEGFVPQSYRIPYCVFGSLSVATSLILVGSRGLHVLWLRRSLQKVAVSDESQSESELIKNLTWGATSPRSRPRCWHTLSAFCHRRALCRLRLPYAELDRISRDLTARTIGLVGVFAQVRNHRIFSCVQPPFLLASASSLYLVLRPAGYTDGAHKQFCPCLLGCGPGFKGFSQGLQNARAIGLVPALCEARDRFCSQPTRV